VTTAANSSRCWLDRQTMIKKDDVVMRIVVDTMNKTVDTLSHAARMLDGRPAATHIRELSQRISGVTLDALQSWPRDKE